MSMRLLTPVALQRLFNKFNEDYFSSRLPQYRVIYGNSNRHCELGWYHPESRTIKISPFAGYAVKENLLHQLIHIQTGACHSLRFHREIERLMRLNAPIEPIFSHWTPWLKQLPRCRQWAEEHNVRNNKVMASSIYAEFEATASNGAVNWWHAVFDVTSKFDRTPAELFRICSRTKAARKFREACKIYGPRPPQRIRRPGGGRKLLEKKDSHIVPTLERLLRDEVAGDPMTQQKWIRSSLHHLSARLTAEGHQASPPVIARLLKKMGFSLKANQRKKGRVGSPERDKQFKYIALQKQKFIVDGLPVISIDTKKTELIGEFRNKGRTWRKEAEEVNEHDFPGAAVCRAVPFGIYDVAKNAGYVYVGVSKNTPEFVAYSVSRWWKAEGSRIYPKANKLLILADGGGSNGCRSREWKLNLQDKLCDELGLTVTACHYPTGCSKWNPIEHRLFSFISINWEGKPLKTLETMLGYIRGTSTRTGLKVKAFLDTSTYKRGQKPTSEEMERLKLEPHAVCPRWNYTLRP